MRAADLAGFIVRRLLVAVPMIAGAAVVNFLLIHLAPGDPAQILMGDFPAPPGTLEQIRHDYGLDQPLPVQLLRYLGEVAQGNLGHSFANRQPVASLILDRLGATLLLTVTALAVASVLGVALGIVAARRQGSRLDTVVQVVSLAGYSVPEFWLGQLLILVFAVWLGWLPAQGAASVRNLAPPGLLERLSYLALPAAALSVRYLALIARITRSAMIQSLSAEYVLAARLRGASETRVLLGHALRNAAAPVVTVIGYNAGFVLAGSALIETVFGWPGIGRLLFGSISQRDTPVMLGILLLVSVSVVVANLLTDIVHQMLDPRVKG
jgi:peptide/nickel transport system permease protein